VTSWTQQDYDRIGDRNADQVTASRLNLQAEYEHGKATAWQMTERSAEGGQNADRIEQRHMELNGGLVNSAWRKVSIPSARVLHRSCTRASWGAVTRARARRGASVAWLGCGKPARSC
jgi:hypothetical protein